MSFERIGKQILAHGAHYADAADDTAAQFMLEALQEKASRTPRPLADEMLGVLRKIEGAATLATEWLDRINDRDGTALGGPQWFELGRAIHAARTLIAKVEAGEGVKRYRHKKRGTTYEMIGTAELQAAQPQCEHAELAIYRGDDGKLWARNTAEFHDGRFEEVPPPASPQSEKGL